MSETMASEPAAVAASAEPAAQQPERPIPVGPLGAYVRARVSGLAAGYLADRSKDVAALAALRNAAGRPIGASPQALQWTIAGLPDDVAVGGADPSSEELATHAAITLFAVHQQSNRAGSAHRSNRSIGHAVARLHGKGDNREGVQRRFDALGTATDWEEIVRHARGLIQMLRGADIPLDYGVFAEDLAALADPRHADGVRLRWGRDFYRTVYRADAKAAKSATA